eukprot:scaffold3350_cov268-Pinguiococcus_pyrenoidosus.AAC.28
MVAQGGLPSLLLFGRLEDAKPTFTFTRAPMTPRLVNRRYSNGRWSLNVLRKGYRYSGICALRNRALVCGRPGSVRLRQSFAELIEARDLTSRCDATHWSSASALHTRLEARAVNVGGISMG